MNEDNEQTSDNDLKRVIELGTMVKTLGGWIFGIVAVVMSVVFWVQSQGSDKYYPKLAGENLEKQLSRMEQKFDSLEDGNREIIKLLGRLEATQERNNR